MTIDRIEGEPWNGDVLDRRQVSQFLYRYVMNRWGAVEDGALCFALEGDWGAGKTFFVKNWQRDLDGLQHPVVRFDAWANDLSDDPLVAFMASIREQIDPWVRKLPVADRIQEQGREQLRAVFANAGRAVLPVGKAIAAGALRKLAGIEFDELAEAVHSDKVGLRPTVLEGVKGLGGEAIEAAFSEVMKAHEDRRSAVSELRRSIESLLDHLDSHAQARLPMFVFVDELDRCRPDYAIRLLEGVKHLFDVRGVCFAISTNLGQLSESTKAVYGAGFDAKRYLKRFFDFEYALPEPNHEAFARSIVGASYMAKSELDFVPAVPSSEPGDHVEAVARDFAFVSKAFDLDLRSQKQVLKLFEAAVSGISSGPVYVYPLVFLACLLYRSRGAFEQAALPWSGTGSLDVKTLHEAGFRDVTINVRTQTRQGEPRIEMRAVSAWQIMNLYVDAARRSLIDLVNVASQDRQGVYPDLLRTSMAREASGRALKPDEKSSAAAYPQLLRAAGQIS